MDKKNLQLKSDRCFSISHDTTSNNFRCSKRSIEISNLRVFFLFCFWMPNCRIIFDQIWCSHSYICFMNVIIKYIESKSVNINNNIWYDWLAGWISHSDFQTEILLFNSTKTFFFFSFFFRSLNIISTLISAFNYLFQTHIKYKVFRPLFFLRSIALYIYCVYDCLENKKK